MHTKSYNDKIINIDKLTELTKDYVPINKEITSLDLTTIDITKVSGFSEKRFKEANISEPIIVDYNYGIIDGRHRLLKSLLKNKSIISVIRVDKKVIMDCVLPDLEQ